MYEFYTLLISVTKLVELCLLFKAFQSLFWHENQEYLHPTVGTRPAVVKVIIKSCIAA